MDEVRIIETHWATDHSLGDGEYETRWWVKRSLWKRWWIFWFFNDVQIIRKDPNHAISNATLGGKYTWDLVWRRKFLGKPHKIIYQ